MTLHLREGELRQLANVELNAIAQLCLLLTKDEVNTYLDYIISGATSFKKGFNDEPD